MIQVVFEQDHVTFMNKVRDFIKEGYGLVSADCRRNVFSPYQPFYYTAVLIIIR